jgi:hypothetical protein
MASNPESDSDPLAMKILDGGVLHGDHVIVSTSGGKVKFEVSRRVGEQVPAAAR